MLTFLVPSAYGFGSVPYSGVLSGNREIRVNTYFGPQPFTEAPQYMGVVVLALAIVGFLANRRNLFVQYLGGMVILSLLIAFGREFPIVYDLMYNFFPTFNKFRIPSMILVLVQIMIPLLAGYGIVFLFTQRDRTLPLRTETRLKYGLGGLSVLLLLSLVASSFVIGIYEILMPRGETVAFFSQRYGNTQVADELYRFVTELVVADVRIALMLLLAAGAVAYFFLKGRISFAATSGILLILIVGDLWRVSSRPMEPQEQQGLESQFAAPDYVQFLQQDSTSFRVLELIDGHPPTSNTLAYWRIQSAYGYHGAKLRAYQDVVDVVGLNNPLVQQLMNVKYMITNQLDSTAALRLVYTGSDRYVYVNETARDRAFFVDTAAVASGLEILGNIRDRRFTATDVAYLMEDPGLALDPPGPEAQATITAYGIQALSINVKATGRNLLFLSETYYPEGWVARLNGTEIPIYRVNYLFRAVVIPPGEHILTMVFEPEGFALGKNLSLGANIIVLGGLVVVGIRHIRRTRPSGSGKSDQQSSRDASS
jgi:hypothetical protein